MGSANMEKLHVDNVTADEEQKRQGQYANSDISVDELAVRRNDHLNDHPNECCRVEYRSTSWRKDQHWAAQSCGVRPGTRPVPRGDTIVLRFGSYRFCP